MTAFDPTKMTFVYDGVAYPCIKIPDVANVNTRQVLSNGDMILISRISRKDLPFEAYDNVKESQQKLDKAITNLSYKKRRLTPEERQKIVEIYTDGKMSVKEIAALYHVKTTYIYHLASAASIGKKRIKDSVTGRPKNTSLREEIKKLKNSGVSVADIAKKKNVSPSRIYQLLNT